jgi:inner membrane protein
MQVTFGRQIFISLTNRLETSSVLRHTGKMDPFSQAVLGGAVAQLFFHRRLGRRAFVMGAIGGAIPDFDIVYQVDQWSSWVHHRGITHSLFFPFVAGPVLAVAAWSLRKSKNKRKNRPPDPPGDFTAYILVWVLAILTHPLLDLMTPYGTQLLLPFSNQRFAVNAMAIIDPMFTVPLMISAAIALLMPERLRLVVNSAAVALLISNGFIYYAWTLNNRVEDFAKSQLQAEGVADARITGYPTVFQAFLRRILVERSDEVRVGYISAWQPSSITWQSFQPRHHPLIDKVKESRGGQILHWFSMSRDYYRIVEQDNQIIVEGHDLRYGIPGPADIGFWGVRAVFDTDEQPVMPVARFTSRPRLNMAGVKMIFDAAAGNQQNQFFTKKDLSDEFRE